MNTSVHEQYKGAKVLITGASGFTGKVLTRKLVEAGAIVNAIARPSSNIDDLSDLDITWFRGDVFDPDTITEAVKDVEYIFHLAAAFREAEENDAILFLDEADSLFINRQTANRSWETSQTNEILTQMENFSGILICCTNLLENLDEAAMRRFAFKIKFLPLTEEGKLCLYRKYFSMVNGSLSPEEEIHLSKVRSLCPGDIKAVWQRTRFMGHALTHGEVIQELAKEVSYKKYSSVPIGFTQ